MANATATPTIDAGGPKGLRIFNDIDMAHVWGTVAISASPATYVTGGLPLAWNIKGFPSNIPPYHVECVSVAGNAAYSYLWNSSTGNLQVFTAAGAELASASAIPAAVSGDTIRFQAFVQRD